MDKDKKKYTFPKRERITSKIVIAQIFKKGKIFKAFPFSVRFLENQEIDVSAKILISASKKRIKNAVDRNRIKRIIREAYRLNKNILFSCLENIDKKIVLHLNYTGNKNPKFVEIEPVVVKILKQLCEKLSSYEKK